MSFDVCLTKPPCECCKRPYGTLFEFNLTHNVNKIVDACFVAAHAPTARSPKPGSAYNEWSWGRLNGWAAKDALPVLQIAYAEAVAPWRETEFRAMAPPNRWGSLDDVRDCLRRLRLACLEHPDAVIEASG